MQNFQHLIITSFFPRHVFTVLLHHLTAFLSHHTHVCGKVGEGRTNSGIKQKIWGGLHGTSVLERKEREDMQKGLIWLRKVVVVLDEDVTSPHFFFS